MPSGQAIDHLLRDGDAVERVLGVARAVDGDRGPAQAPAGARHRRDHMRADRLAGIADGDRNLNGRIEHLAPVRQPLMRVAPNVKLLRRAADEHRDRLERELGLARCFGRVGLPGLGRLGGARGCRGRVELRLRVGFGGVELRAQLRGPCGCLLLLVLGLWPWPGPSWRRRAFARRRELSLGAGCERCSSLRSDAVSDAVSRFAAAASLFACLAILAASSASRASASARAGAAAMASGFGTNRAGWENATGSASFGEMMTRVFIRTLSNSLSAKPKGRRTQPFEAGCPGNGPPCSAMPFQVTRSMCGIQASS